MINSKKFTPGYNQSAENQIPPPFSHSKGSQRKTSNQQFEWQWTSHQKPKRPEGSKHTVLRA